MEQNLRFVNGPQALRRETSALGIGLGGALGVAADPLLWLVGENGRN